MRAPKAVMLIALAPLFWIGGDGGETAALAQDAVTEETKGATGRSDGSDGAASGSESPLETARNAEKGSLTNPYGNDAKVVEDGHAIYMAAGCNGCHGGGGGGGMAPPLTNKVWIYGQDDDTLFRVIALGTDELQSQGYSRQGSENVVGPMPPSGNIVKSTDDMWKIITWMRSVNSD